MPGPKTILYFLHEDPEMQALDVPLPRLTRTIWKILRKHDRIFSRTVRRLEAQERPDPLVHWQIDFKDASTVPADPFGKQQHVVEILNIVDAGTSMVLESHVHANFHAQTALEALARTFQTYGLPDQVTLDRDPLLSLAVPASANFPQHSCDFCCVWASPSSLPAPSPLAERSGGAVSSQC